jgi:chromosome segregation protein
VRGQEARVNEARGLHAKAQEAYNAFRERFSGLRSQLNAWHRQSAELHNQREEVSRELAVMEERRRSLVTAQSSVLADTDRTSDEERVAHERLLEAQQEVQRLESEFDEAQRQFTDSQAALHNRQAERAGVEEELKIARAELETGSAQRAEAQARLEELRSRLDSLQLRLENAGRAVDASEAHTRDLREKYEQARQRRETAEQAWNEAVRDEEQKRREADQLEQERRARADERAQRLAEHTRLKAQIEVLEQAEESLAGYAEGARYLLDAARQMRLRGARGALSTSLDVPAELETALTAALGDTLDAILLDSEDVEQALQLLEADESGRAALLPLDGPLRQAFSKPTDEAVLGFASELVNAPAELRPAVDLILGQTLVVRDRAAARRLIRDLPAHARVVTLRGEVFRGDGLIIAGRSHSAGSSALSRPRQKRELSESLAALNAQIEEMNRDVDSLSARIGDAQRELARMSEDARTARLRLDEAQAAEQQAGLESESARRQLEWQESQRDQLKTEAEEAALLRQNLIQSQAEVESRSTRLQEQARSLTERLAGMDLAEAQSQASYWNTRLAVVERAREDARLRREEREKDVARFDTRRFELTTRLHEAETSLSGLDESKASLRERETHLHTQIEELRVFIEPAEKDLETAEQEESRLQEAEANSQRSLAHAERTLGQVQLEQMRKQEALDNLRQKISDDFGLVMFDYAADITGPVPLPFEGMVEELPVVTEVSPELEQQLIQNRTHLRRLGPINPEAKQEFDRESERYAFMKTQVEDLQKAEQDLKKVIAELDELTKLEFSKTFDAVDKQFRAMFTRLFGGGSARLALTDPDNLVETGIEIEARLPGRREQGLALLSGGERSLTAVALVFALLKVSPTPVCVMDEVDAMLDEANVGRFRDLLQELSRDTQFIIITHNRNTVQAADVIYGITMGRDSASQIISLRLDQVTDEMLQRA